MGGFLDVPLNHRQFNVVTTDRIICEFVSFGFVCCFVKETNRNNFILKTASVIAYYENSCDIEIIKGKGKSVPLQAWSCPKISRKLRFPNFLTTAQEGGKFVSLTHRPHLLPGYSSGTHFC